MQETWRIRSRCLRNEIEITNSSKKTHSKNWVGSREGSPDLVKRKANLGIERNNEEIAWNRRGQTDLNPPSKSKVENQTHEGSRCWVEHALGPSERVQIWYREVE